MRTALMTIVVEHFLMTRGLSASDLNATIPVATAICKAIDVDAVQIILDKTLDRFNLPVEDTDEPAEDFFLYAAKLAPLGEQ